MPLERRTSRGTACKPVISKFSILRPNRDMYYPHFEGTPPLPVCLCTTCCFTRHSMGLSASPFATYVARPSSNRFAAGRGGAQRTYCTWRSFHCLKLALRRRSIPLPPPPKKKKTNSLRFASFCELLRWPLRAHVKGLKRDIQQSITCTRIVEST